ncbi:MAG TPA: cellulase family glycosylhydrolase [Baekduia sp.]|nr:cellulase family glycosylhydrolase [Baekduia sp.]
MTLLRRLLPAALLVALLAAVPAAHAKTNQEVTFEAPRDFFDPGQREAAFQTLDGLGVHAIRVVLYWDDVAPDHNSRARPKVDLTDPASYDWGTYQPVLDEAHARGWAVQLTVSGPVPRWATNGARNHVTRPRPSDFESFMTAVARQYRDQVTRWAIWNEPNHPQFLKPQYVGHGRHKRPASPAIYRKLYAAALDGLKAAGDDKPVLMGETAPMGTGKDVAPLTFLRGALCLNSHYKQHGHCGRLRVDGYAHHAYTTRKGPKFKPVGKNNVTIGVLSRLTKALDRAARAHVVTAHLPVYLTEFGIQSKPDPIYGVSLRRQAEYRSYSEWLSWVNPRVAAFSQYLLTDDPPEKGKPKLLRYGGFESGLRLATGKDKPALAGFRLPLVVRDVHRRASLWGLVRPASGSTTVVVQVRDPHRKWKKLATVRTNSHGVWTRHGSLGSRKRTWRVLWKAPDGTRYKTPPTHAM